MPVLEQFDHSHRETNENRRSILELAVENTQIIWPHDSVDVYLIIHW